MRIATHAVLVLAAPWPTTNEQSATGNLYAQTLKLPLPSLPRFLVLDLARVSLVFSASSLQCLLRPAWSFQTQSRTPSLRSVVNLGVGVCHFDLT